MHRFNWQQAREESPSTGAVSKNSINHAEKGRDNRRLKAECSIFCFFDQYRRTAMGTLPFCAGNSVEFYVRK